MGDSLATVHSLSHQNQQSCPFSCTYPYIKFTLISTKEISQLIYNCLNFLAKNLPEATVNQDDLEQGLPDGEVQEQSQIN